MKRAFSNSNSLNFYQLSLSAFLSFNLYQLILGALLIFTMPSCSKSCDDTPEIPDTISEEIKELIYFRGGETAPIVIINAQGGPDVNLSTDIVDLIADNLTAKDVLSVNPHQAQTLNPDILNESDITLDQAVAFNTESIDILYKVTKYFKDQGRTVYVLGNSFGAFISQELIAQKGIDVADKYLLISGRLNMNDLMWQASSEGREAGFENGITPIIDPEPHAVAWERNLMRISAGLAMNRYTQVLDNIDDLSMLTYIYGTTDEAVGSLTPEEVQFLESKNANIISGSGGHADTFYEFFAQGMNEAFGLE